MLSARCELTGLELPTCDLTKYFISLPYKATLQKAVSQCSSLPSS